MKSMNRFLPVNQKVFKITRPTSVDVALVSILLSLNNYLLTEL